MSNLALKHPAADLSSGGQLVATDGRTLPLKEAVLRADARNGVARVVLEQRFTNPYAEPLAVTYQMPLPADGAVAGYAFTIGARRITGEVDRKKAARERFEQALVQGRTAGIVDQERTSLFTQEIGNIPPGQDVVCELSVDQKLAWLPEGMWEWRFPTVLAPRYMGEAGRVADVQKVSVEIADKPMGTRLTLNLCIRDVLTQGKAPESPSHTLFVTPALGHRQEVSLQAEKGASLDRDVVVRWAAVQPKVGVTVDVARTRAGTPLAGSAFGLLTITPPSPDSRGQAVARDLIVLLDTSGSMAGEPLAQARRVVSALIETLKDNDRLEMIEFSNAPRRWKSRAVDATAANRVDAQAWLAKLQAGGGTEMRSGILEALAPLRPDSQRQIVLLTDGLIGSEDEVIQAINERLPASSRVHTVGIGSGVNRSLTSPVARAGRGVELVIGIGEDAERAANRLVARTNAPLITELEVSGSAVLGRAPEKLPDLFGGAPALLSLKLNPQGGEIIVRGHTANGSYEQKISCPAVDFAHGSAAVTTLFGREAVEDLETRLAAGGGKGEVDQLIEKIGLDFQISTRLTSWVAVSDEVTVDPTSATRREKVPQELPYGMSIEGLGLRSAMPVPVGPGSAAHGAIINMSAPMAAPAPASMPPQARTGAPPSAPRAAPMRPAGRPSMSKSVAKDSGSDDKLDSEEGADGMRPSTEERSRRAEPKGGGEGLGGLIDKAKRAFGLGSSKEEAEPSPKKSSAPPPPPARQPVAAPPQDLFAAEAEQDEGAPPPEETTGSFAPVQAAVPAELELKRREQRPAMPGVRRLQGTVRTLESGELVVEITVDAQGLEFDQPAEVALTWQDGAVLTAVVDPAKSTRPMSAGAGMVLRLTLTLPKGREGQAPRQLAFRSLGVHVIIEL